VDLVGGILASLSPEYLLYAFVGCLLGTLVGVLPGLGASSSVAILFPFTAYLPPEGMLITLTAIYYGAQYGGSTTAILINVPGETSSMVTAIDGYQMTRQGRPGPALCMAALTSFMAGITGAIVISFVGPTIARLALLFGPAEYLGLALFSLTGVAAFCGRSVLKGVIVIMVGMLLASVGYDASSGLPRMTYGSVDMLRGLDVVPVMIGLFGIGEVLHSLQEKRSALVTKIGSLLPSKAEFKAGMAAGARATGLSLVLGLFPGMMPSIGSFLSYSLEKYRSPTPERFGKGAIEGVAAAEAANNATAMSNLVPMLSLGIPTGPTTALMIAAFMVYGIVPGPALFTQHADLVWTLIGSFFVANVILVVLNLPLVGIWVRLATIPYPILAPCVLVICIVGAYSTRTTMFDVLVCVAFGFVGWGMRLRQWPLPPLVLAYVLGPTIESSARQVLAISPGLLLERPVFWAFVVLSLGSLWFSRRIIIKGDDLD
jgi:putative tricarboxylic transport membrane protein